MEGLIEIVQFLNDRSATLPLSDDHDKNDEVFEKTMKIETKRQALEWVDDMENLDIFDPEDKIWISLKRLLELRNPIKIKGIRKKYREFKVFTHNVDGFNPKNCSDLLKSTINNFDVFHLQEVHGSIVDEVVNEFETAGYQVKAVKNNDRFGGFHLVSAYRFPGRFVELEFPPDMRQFMTMFVDKNALTWVNLHCSVDVKYRLEQWKFLMSLPSVKICISGDANMLGDSGGPQQLEMASEYNDVIEGYHTPPLGPHQSIDYLPFFIPNAKNPIRSLSEEGQQKICETHIALDCIYGQGVSFKKLREGWNLDVAGEDVETLSDHPMWIVNVVDYNN